MKKVNKIFKLIPLVAIAGAIAPLVTITGCNKTTGHITIDESAKTQTADNTGSAVYAFTLSEDAKATDFSTPTISCSETLVSLTATIASVTNKTLKVKVTSNTNDLSNLDVTFSITIATTNGGWSQTITNMKLNGISISKYSVTMNAGEHGYFGTAGTTTKTLSKKYSKVSQTDLTEPTSSDSTKYSFSGWYKTAECVDEFDFAKTLTADTTIYAGWAEVPVVDPKIEYDTTLFNVVNDSQTKTVTVTPIAGQTITTDSAITLTGTWQGYQFNFIPSEDDTQELQINLNNFVLVGDSTRCPFNIQKANDGAVNEMSFASVDLSVTKKTSNYIYDGRSYGSTTTDGLKGAINAKADLKIKSTGFLKINDSTKYKGFSQGIHCTKDLTIQKCTLNVAGYATAIKGNKSIYIGDSKNEGSTTVTATSATGDGLKTEDIDVSSKGKRRGDITVYGDSTTITINSTKDAFQAAHNLYIGTTSAAATTTTPKVQINTGTFNKSWSETVVTDSQDLYFRVKYSDHTAFTNPSTYTFKVYFSNSTATSEGEEVEATLKKISAGNDPGASWSNAYAYWNCNRPFGYSKAFIKLYAADGTLKATSNGISISYPSKVMSNDLLTLSTLTDSKISAGSISSNYKQTTTGQSGSRAGKTDYSSKGMKAANLTIAGGTIVASVCDDFIHTKYGQNFPAGGSTATLPVEIGAGNITITGGTITLNDCPDDGIHADGSLTIGTSGGSETDLTIALTPDRDYSNNYCCYEGLEASTINIYSGTTKVFTKDDGVNASCCGNTVLTGVSINVYGGLLDITARGNDVDGIDTNYNYNQTGGTVISKGTQGSALDIGDDQNAKATITAGTLILLGKNEPAEKGKMVYTGTTKSTISGKSAGTYTLQVGSTEFSIYCKYNYTENGSVYSSLGSASWK